MKTVYLRRRIVFRALLAATAMLIGTGLMIPISRIARSDAHPREFLFEPASAPDRYVFTLDLPGMDAGKPLRDFLVSGRSAVEYRVLRVAPYGDHAASRKGAPFTVALLFDQSQSIAGMPGIAGTDPRGSRLSAGRHFVESVSAGTRVGVFTFGGDQGPDPGRERARIGSPRSALLKAIGGLKGHEGANTPTYQALLNILDQIESAWGDKAIICFTDGPPDPQELSLSDAVIQAARQADTSISFVALGPANTDWSGNEAIARASGGTLIRVQDASKLNAAFLALSSRMRSRYGARITVRASQQGAFLSDTSLTPDVRVRGTKFDKTYTVPIDLTRIFL